MAYRLRLSPFCAIVGEERETVRSLVNRNEAPIPREVPGMGAQRTYGGEDVLRWFGFRELRNAGLRLHRAAHLMRYSGALETFMESKAAGQDVRHFCLFHAEEYPMGEAGGIFELAYTFLPDGDVRGFLEARADAGRMVRHAVAVPFLPVYLECLEAVAAQGLTLIGTDLADDEE